MDTENISRNANINRSNVKTSDSQKSSQMHSTPAKKASTTVKVSINAKKNQTPVSKDNALRPKTATPYCKTPKTSTFNDFSFSSDTSFDGTPKTPGTNDARESARVAKLQSTQKTITKVQLLKEKWAKEKEQKLNGYKERRDLEKRKILEESMTASELRHKQLEKQREIEEKNKIAEKQDIIIRHESNILMKQEVEKQKQAKRRISVFLNHSIRKKQVEKQAQMEEMKKSQDQEDLSLKRMDYLNQRQNKVLEDMRRRESLHNRLELSKEQKEKEKELMNTLYHSTDKELLETRYNNWQDEKTYKKQVQEQELEDLQKQNELFKEQKEKEKQLQTLKELENINLLKTKELNWKDEQLYKEHLKQEEKNEVLFKSNQWKLTKEQEKQSENALSLQKTYEFELTKQAHNDMKSYRSKCHDDRRQSLSYRLAKARKDKDFEKGQEAAKQILIEEEIRINELDREDVATYKQKIMDARRQSLEYRAQTEYQERMRLEGEQKAKLHEETVDLHAKYEDWKDVQQYRETERQKDREDLAWKLANAHRQHEHDLTQHQDKLSKMHMDYQCRREDWLSLNEYKKKEADNRRKSVQFRLDSWRKQRLMEENEKMKELMMKEETVIYNEMDREELLAAKLTEEMMERHNLLTSEMKL
jgi:hypothetical protein